MYSNTALNICDDDVIVEDIEGDEALAEDLGGSKIALGLSCHSFVESDTTLSCHDCTLLMLSCRDCTLFLSGSGGPDDGISDDDGVSDEGGLGGATADEGV